jgi:hypothetical protein
MELGTDKLMDFVRDHCRLIKDSTTRLIDLCKAFQECYGQSMDPSIFSRRLHLASDANKDWGLVFLAPRNRSVIKGIALRMSADPSDVSFESADEVSMDGPRQLVSLNKADLVACTKMFSANGADRFVPSKRDDAEDDIVELSLSQLLARAHPKPSYSPLILVLDPDSDDFIELSETE